MRKRLLSLITAVAMSFTLMAAPVAASTASTTLPFAGTATVQSFGPVSVICDPCAPDALFGGANVGLGARVTLSAVAQWNPSARVDYQYSPSLLRQGQTLDLVDTLTGQSGPLVVTYHAAGDYGIYFNDTFPADASVSSLTAAFDLSTSGSGTCTLKLSGDGTYDCQTTKTITIFSGDLFGLVGASITMPVTTTINITPDGVATVRTVTVSGSTIKGPDLLTFNGPTPSVVSDSFAVLCTAPVGANALYDLASSQSNPTLVASTNVSVDIEITIIISLGGSVSLGTFGPSSPVTMNLTAPSNQVDLGPILANNVPPNTVAGGPYSGLEGSPIQFDGSGTTSICPVGLAFRWDFSDGGIAYGVQPFHTFADNGTFSGQVTATDPTGLSNTANFSVSVANQNPIANAGPDTNADWGRLVTFNGQATDPGAGDQATLQYSWDFGDGTPPTTPSGSGGSGVSHAYATPGAYEAILTVSDKNGGSETDTRTVNVTKRDTTTAYLGDTAGTYDTPGQLSASLVDEYGANLNGKSVAFTVGVTAPGSASTNSSGIATRSYTPLLAAGPYVTGAAFGGDSLYNGSVDTGSIAIARKATTVTYTGALSGGANKTITLSAILADASGTRLAGRTVDFKLGSQTKSALTDANGVATTSLKLAQKNGTYPLTATFTPAGADAGTYLASSDAESFKLQTR